MRQATRVLGAATLIGLAGVAIVTGVDAVVAQTGGSDDLVWMLGPPVAILAGMTAAGLLARRREDAPWKLTIAAVLLVPVVVGVGLFLSVPAAMSLRPMDDTSGDVQGLLLAAAYAAEPGRPAQRL